MTTVRCRARTAAGSALVTCSFTVTVRCQQVQLTRNPGALTLSWKCGGRLESAASAAGPWAEVHGATAPFQIQPTGPGQFFRVRY